MPVDKVFRQPIDSADQGVKFYESRLKILISENHDCTASFYSYIVGGINCCLGILDQLGKADDDYFKVQKFRHRIY